MPSALAKGKKLGLRYNPNITMPKSLAKWSEYIKKFIRFLLGRYGAEEVESWYFEIWNEPDLSCFFAGSQKDYFRLYEATVRAIKEVNPNLRVGGPSTSACLWLEEFLAFCKEKDVPCDFVSTHHYPGDAFGNFINLKNVKQMLAAALDAAKNHRTLSETMAKMFFLPEDFIRWDKGTLAKMDDEAKAKVGDRPLFITERNSMAVFGSPVHDEKYSAAFAVKSCMDLNNTLAGYMFWCCSDLFEEQFMLPRPFVGSFGIVSNDGIPKPNFWGFKLLSQLYPKRLNLPMRTNEKVEYAAFVDGDKTQILIFAQDQDYHKNETHEITIEVNCDAKNVTQQRIDDTHCNPKAEWVKLGSPDNLTLAQVEGIKEKTRLRAEPILFTAENGATKLSVQLHTNDVVLITLT
jgi:xylan 1,4-beta-xylosidase